MNKRNDSDYIQISFLIPKELARTFRHHSTEIDLKNSEAGQKAIEMWCLHREKILKGKENPT